MKTIEVTVRHASGLHARPATEFVKVANRFQSEISIAKEDREVNAKSIVGVLALGIAKDTSITLSADGTDETEALEALKRLVENEGGA